MGTAGGCWRLQLSHSWLTWRSSDTPTGAHTHASAHKHTLGSSGSWWRLIWEVKPFTHCLQRQNIQHLPPRLPVELFFLPYLPLSGSLFLCYPAGLRRSVFSLLVLSRLHASARRKLLYKLGIQKNGNTCKSNKAALQPVKLHQCWGGYVHSVQSQRSLWCCCLGCITDRERKSCILKTPECITHTSLINTWGGIRSVFFNCIYRPDPDIMLAPVSLLWA